MESWETALYKVNREMWKRVNRDKKRPARLCRKVKRKKRGAAVACQHAELQQSSPMAQLIGAIARPWTKHETLSPSRRATGSTTPLAAEQCLRSESPWLSGEWIDRDGGERRDLGEVKARSGP